jgi:hypothetical protein
MTWGLLVACGDSEGSATQDAGRPSDRRDSGMDRDAGGGGGGTVSFAAVVRDPTSDVTIEGTTVQALDNETGEPLGIEEVSGNNGAIAFEGLPAGKVAFLSVGQVGMTIDTYQYNIDADAQDETLWVVAKSTAQIVPTLASLTPDPESAAVSGAVYWVNADGVEEPVGCATIAFEGEGEATEYRYFGDNNLPTTLEMQASTNLLNGRYFIGNAPTGVQRVSAQIDGESMGETTLVLFARKDSTDGEDNVCISNIYIEGVDENPTPADCE